jgi:UDP-N-acetylmuramate--alanine ligase
MRPAPIPPLFGRDVNRIHCLGVGGMGVAPLAIYLARSGWRVSGQDDAPSPEVETLLAGAGVAIGPLPPECDLVVRSSAVPTSHPAYLAAQERGVACARRGELLAEVVRNKKLVAICGSHGKTTTTAMLVAAAAARQAFPAGFISRRSVQRRDAPAAPGSNEWVVAEVDESDGTIGGFSPEITVIVNLDWDHPDRYGSPADFEEAFAALCSGGPGARCS